MISFLIYAAEASPIERRECFANHKDLSVSPLALYQWEGGPITQCSICDEYKGVNTLRLGSEKIWQKAQPSHGFFPLPSQDALKEHISDLNESLSRRQSSVSEPSSTASSACATPEKPLVVSEGSEPYRTAFMNRLLELFDPTQRYPLELKKAVELKRLADVSLNRIYSSDITSLTFMTEGLYSYYLLNNEKGCMLIPQTLELAFFEMLRERKTPDNVKRDLDHWRYVFAVGSGHALVFYCERPFQPSSVPILHPLSLLPSPLRFD